MQLRAALLLAACLGGGCGGAAAGKIMAETPVPTKEDPKAVLVPYAAPDISELTGIEEPDEDEPEATAATPSAEPKL